MVLVPRCLQTFDSVCAMTKTMPQMSPSVFVTVSTLSRHSFGGVFLGKGIGMPRQTDSPPSLNIVLDNKEKWSTFTTVSFVIVNSYCMHCNVKHTVNCI